MVPKIAHFIWFGNESRKEPDFDTNVDIFRQLHLHWEVRYWHDKDLEEFGEAWFKYANAPNFFRIEYVKLLVLARYGGLTMDLDVRTLKPVDRLLEPHCQFYTTWMDGMGGTDFCIVAAEKNSPVISSALRNPHAKFSISRTIFEICLYEHPTRNGFWWWPTIAGDYSRISEDTYFWHRNAGTWKKYPKGDGFVFHRL